jgi:U3 small nucleolar RNA-associated protein 25
MIMQNWDHVNDVLQFINQQPKKITSFTDFSRVRNYMLAGHACYWKQLIILSSLLDPCIISTYKRYAVSIAGQVQFRNKYIPTNASFSDIVIPYQRQVFYKIPCTMTTTTTSVSLITNQTNDRIQFFTNMILPQLINDKKSTNNSKCTRTLIYIPSYFDYISICNILQKRQDDIQFGSITEYTKNLEVTRTRSYFLKGYTTSII